MRRRRFHHLAMAGLLMMLSSTASAAVIKLSFSTDSKPDFEVVHGVLSTVDDEVLSTAGDQNTEVTLLDVLEGLVLIEGDGASFTLDNVQLQGSPVVVVNTVLQATSGGTFSLYDQSNVLLLSGTLGNGTLSGPLGSTATGGFLTTEFGTFTGGSLLAKLEQAGMTRSSLSISMTDVSNGAGLQLAQDGSLQSFFADATANISAHESVPEPHGYALMYSALAAVYLGLRRPF